MAKVSIQGEIGSFSHDAANAFFRKGVEINPCEDMEKALESTANGTTTYSVVPMENSISGIFPLVYETLVKYPKLQILGEFVQHESFCLLALPSTPLSGVKTVTSHPVVIDQCRRFLSSIGVSAKQTALSYDTAGACAALQASKCPSSAVLASKSAAKVYGLSVLQEKCEDDSNTATRYVIIGETANRTPVQERASFGNTKTSLVFCLRNETGAFFRAVGCFSLRNISIAKVEMCPSRRCSPTARVWEYVNFIDVEANISDAALKKAIANLEEFCVYVKILGSYKTLRVDDYDASVIHGCT